MAKRRKGRPVDGVLILDKPQGKSSNGALQRVRWLLQAQKAGHTGSLDPLATGVLPLCFGEATKFSRYLLDADKGYYTTAKLGEIRDSGDSDGNVVETRPVPRLSEDQLEPYLDDLRGDIKQVPSMYSALKHEGRPLYEYARKGIEIARPARDVSIYRFEQTALREDEIDLTVECSKGTYVRSLVEDLGLALGCGAHVSMLRRFKAGHFELAQAHSQDKLDQLEGDFEALDALLLPVDALLPNFPFVFVNNSMGRSLLHGQAVRIPPSNLSGLMRLYVPEDLNQPDQGADLKQRAESQSVLVEQSGRPDHAEFAGVVELTSAGELIPKRLVTFNA